MKKFNLLLTVILLTTTLSYAQNCDYASNFEWVKQTFEQNDAGFQYGIQSNADYVYKDAQLYQERKQMVFDKTLIVKTYTYSTVEDKKMTEVYYEDPNSKYLSEKITYQDDKKIEYIKYHPGFPGQEWYCVRYEYL